MRPSSICARKIPKQSVLRADLANKEDFAAEHAIIFAVLYWIQIQFGDAEAWFDAFLRN